MAAQIQIDVVMNQEEMEERGDCDAQEVSPYLVHNNHKEKMGACDGSAFLRRIEAFKLP